MKKIFTLIALIGTVLTASATDYKGNLAVVLGESSLGTQQATIIVNKQTDGKYELQLNNFSLPDMPVGDIKLPNVEATEENGKTNLYSKQTITITGEGLGSMLPPLEVEMKAVIENGALKANIIIPFYEVNINVLFNSSTLQIPNSDFELFHKETSGKKTADEPNHWHSFLSATGNLADTQNAFSAPHTEISTDVRPGTAGSKSILLKATSILGIVANGTMTTGRMVAGSMTATDTKNHAFLDLSNTDKDANGDPFYATLAGRPDSLVAWVKFKQAKASADFPYATINAVITDGERYQDPEDKAYNNIVAKATNAKIESNNQWTRLSIPFDYESYAANGVDPKAILVTISTNATPGKGAKDDQLYIDDLELVYTPKVEGIRVFGNEVAGFDPKKTEYEIKVPAEPTADVVVPWAPLFTTAVSVSEGTITLTAFSEDLMNYTTYTLNYTIDESVTNGIDNVNNGDKKVVGIYNLNGQRVYKKLPNQIYVTKYADGTTVKALNK